MGENKDPRFRAWYGNVQATMRSLQLIDREVEAAIGLPLASVEVLVNLSHEDGGRMRMGELADTLLLSRGGATRLVARLEEGGLVERVIPPDDRRATYAVLTTRGWQALQEGEPVLQRAVATHVIDHLNENELTAMRTASLKILRVTGSNCDWLMEEPGAAGSGTAPATTAD